MKPVIVSHLDYRRFLNGVGSMYRINWRTQPPAIREIYIRFRELDLSAVDRIMPDRYSNRGPEPRQPSCILRSLLLMIVMNVVSITRWVETLHTSQFFAILSGFQPWALHRHLAMYLFPSSCYFCSYSCLLSFLSSDYEAYSLFRMHIEL